MSLKIHKRLVKKAMWDYLDGYWYEVGRSYGRSILKASA